MKNFMTVTQRKNAAEYLANLTSNTLLIFSPTSMKNLIFENLNVTRVGTDILTKQKEKLDEFIEKNKNQYFEIVGFGGGTATDIAKYIANALNVRLTVIPSMLSTNAYATDKVALFVEGNKRTLLAKLPYNIILDKELLKLATQENLYGFADIFSIHTALKDWEIAENENNEEIDKDIFMQAKTLLEKSIDFVAMNTTENICESIEKLYEFIGIAGEITNIYGTGRPESGSEHIFAKTIEENIDIPHGISVSIGIIVMSIIQKNYNADIYKSIQKINVLNKMEMYGISDEFINKIISQLCPRADRYTVINKLDKDSIDVKTILKTIHDVKEGVIK